MSTLDGLSRGRELFARGAWTEAYATLSSADRDRRLDPEDLQRLAVAAYLVGRDSDSDASWERAQTELLVRGDRPGAARCAFWLAFGLLNRGEVGRGSGWLARAGRVLEDHGQDCVEHGYLLLPAAIRAVGAGDYAAGVAAAGRASDIGGRFGDLDLVTLARHVGGRALIRSGQPAEGMSLLDEAMIAVLAAEVSTVVAGTVYCGVIEACHEVFDVRRAMEWTAALNRWCEAQPGLVAYHGQCLLHRAEIMQLQGAWPDAVDAVQRAFERLQRQPDHPARGAAAYRQAELHRLRGLFAAAEEAYREANRRGHEPQPGLALLRLAQGQVDKAAAAIRRAVHEQRGGLTRAGLLGAYVEIMLAAGDVPAAREGAAQLSELAGESGAPLLAAAAAQATGSVLLADGDARAALDRLREAWAGWHQLAAPFESARVRVLAGRACQQLGDEDGALLEWDAATGVFRELGAAPALSDVEEWARPDPGKGQLTAREVQVLRLIATGRTNRSIAAEITVSEKTVARHISNIFTKLGVPSRSAATAYAYEHGLV